jgi:hypothetical protein
MILQQPLLVRFSSAQLLRIRLSWLHDAQTKTDASCWYLLSLCLSSVSHDCCSSLRAHPNTATTTTARRHLYTHTVFPPFHAYNLFFIRIPYYLSTYSRIELFTHIVCISLRIRYVFCYAYRI